MLSLLSKNKERIYSLFVHLIVFLSSIYPYGDKDWGWHYKYGEYLFKHGKILTKDIFSWTMTGYEWINHSWPYDPILYFLTNTIGFIGLSIVGGIVTFLTFYIITSCFKLSFWKKAILALFFLLINQGTIGYGFRSQVIALLLFAILMSLLIRSQKNIKILFFLPLLFFVWANFHGSFILGLGVAGIFLTAYFFINRHKNLETKRVFTSYYLPLLSSFAVTLVNPFGYKIYLESFRHFSSPYLKNVSEWNPIFQNCSACHPYTFIFYSLLLLSASLFYLQERRYSAIPYLIIIVTLFFPTLDTRRLLSIFCVITLPFFAEVLKDFKWDIGKYRIVNIISISLIIFGLGFNFHNRFTKYKLYNFTENDYCYFSSGCSPAVVSYLISHPPSGKGFNYYDWGGYLIGKSVPAKIFTDGRMHLWEKDGYSVSADYFPIYYHDNYYKFIDYDFDWALIQSDTNLAKNLYYTKELGDWKLQYKDGNTAYFVRVKK
jgi:hypothetical protein